MAATKTSSAILASVSNAAAGTKTSSTINLTTSYGGLVTGKVTNGATGPTLGCTMTLNVSPNGSTFYPWAAGTAATANSAVTTFGFEIPLGALYANVVFTGNTAQSVTVEAQAEWVTAI